MTDTVKRVLWTAIQGFVAGFVLSNAGLGPFSSRQAPTAAIVGGILGGIAAAGALVRTLLPDPAGIRDDVVRLLATFGEGFLAGFLTAVSGAGPLHDFNALKAAIVGALSGAIMAGFAATKNTLLPPGHPAR